MRACVRSFVRSFVRTCVCLYACARVSRGCFLILAEESKCFERVIYERTCALVYVYVCVGYAPVSRTVSARFSRIPGVSPVPS